MLTAPDREPVTHFESALIAAKPTKRVRCWQQVCGVRLPAVISTTDHNVLLDPKQRNAYRLAERMRLPCNWLIGTATSAG